MVALDGSILALPVAAWTEPVTLAGAGFMVMTEGQVDGLVMNSNVYDALGGQPMTIGDLDGLHRAPGTFQNQWGQWNHLLFCGETLTGGAVLTTQGGGAVAQINSTPLANNAAATDGRQVGLRPGGGANFVSSLNGLEVQSAKDLCHYVAETPTPELRGAGTIQVDLEGAIPGFAFLLVGVAPLPITPFLDLPAVLDGGCFPEIFQPALHFATFAVGINAQGQGSWALALPALNGKVVCQALSVDPMTGLVHLSTPLTIELYPQ
jgi:hypothetical protein